MQSAPIMSEIAAALGETAIADNFGHTTTIQIPLDTENFDRDLEITQGWLDHIVSEFPGVLITSVRDNVLYAIHTARK